MNAKQAKALRKKLEYKPSDERDYKTYIYPNPLGLNKKTLVNTGKRRQYQQLKRGRKYLKQHHGLSTSFLGL